MKSCRIFKTCDCLFLTVCSLAIYCFGLVGTAHALPFNDDMVHNQIKTGQVMRPLPEDSIPVGYLAHRIESKAEAMKLINPIPADEASIASGQRLYAVNCFTCHGDITKEKWEPGPSANNPAKGETWKFLTPPDITHQIYAKDRSDAYIFATIHFGGLAVMPALGWKLSHQEHWDIVNYIRSVQKAKGTRE